MPEIALVLPPFAAIERPSMALGILKQCLTEAGMPSRVYHANLWYAEEVGVDAYQLPQYCPINELVGDWIFAGVVFPDFHPDADGYYSKLKRFGQHESLPRTLDALRAQAHGYVDRAARRILKDKPRLVGCSSIFHQHCAALAILKRIKELDPTVVTLLGGGNCEGPMGKVTHRAFPWVDFVVSGEAEPSFPELCRRILADGLEAESPAAWILGPKDRLKTNGKPLSRGLVTSLEDTPVPDYAEFVESLQVSPIAAKIYSALSIETSRGCWWGQKHHCTFCGLNGGGMGFRSKSADRAVMEYEELSERYQLVNFEAVDNILDMTYLDSVLPRLAASPRPFKIFYETKSNLRFEQVQRLIEAGVTWVQPGIESLHDDVLKLMDKGTTGLQNIQFMIYARELGLRISWNFLVDFPGEKDEWYQEMAEWLPRIFHLQPAFSTVKVRFDRFSPYHERPQEYGVVLETGSYYRYIYALSPEDLTELAYFFEDGPGSTRLSTQDDPWPGRSAVGKLVAEWNQRFIALPPLLSMEEHEDCLEILDTRPCATQRMHRLEGPARVVYLAARQARGRSSLVAALEQAGYSADELDPLLADLDSKKLILHQKGRVLALAIRGDVPTLPTPLMFPGGIVNALPSGCL